MEVGPKDVLGGVTDITLRSLVAKYRGVNYTASANTNSTNPMPIPHKNGCQREEGDAATDSVERERERLAG